MGNSSSKPNPTGNNRRKPVGNGRKQANLVEIGNVTKSGMQKSFYYRIDTSYDGNCGYSAYAKSLIAYLQAQDDADLSSKLLSRLGVNEEEQNFLLNADIQKDGKEIENILNPKLRATLQEKTKSSFENGDYKRDNFFQTLQIFIEKVIEDQYKVDLNMPNLFVAVAKNEFDDESIKVPNLSDALTSYIKNNLSLTEDKALRFKEEKKEYPLTVFSDEEIAASHPTKTKHGGLATEEELTERCQYARLRQLSHDILFRFLTKDDNAWFNRYIDFLGTSGTWASIESLASLHEAILNVRREDEENGKINWLHDFNISFEHINEKKEATLFSPENGKILIKNIGNSHWVSLIPQEYYNAIQANKHQAREDSNEGAEGEHLLPEAAAEARPMSVMEEPRRSLEQQFTTVAIEIFSSIGSPKKQITFAKGGDNNSFTATDAKHNRLERSGPADKPFYKVSSPQANLKQCIEKLAQSFALELASMYEGRSEQELTNAKMGLTLTVHEGYTKDNATQWKDIFEQYGFKNLNIISHVQESDNQQHVERKPTHQVQQPPEIIEVCPNPNEELSDDDLSESDVNLLFEETFDDEFSYDESEFDIRENNDEIGSSARPFCTFFQDNSSNEYHERRHSVSEEEDNCDPNPTIRSLL